MGRAVLFRTTVSRAGQKAPATNLKTYIPAQLVKALALQHGDHIVWRQKGRKIIITVAKKVEKNG